MCTATIKSQKLGGGLYEALSGRWVIIVVIAVRHLCNSAGDKVRSSLRTRELAVSLLHVKSTRSEDAAWRAVSGSRATLFVRMRCSARVGAAAVVGVRVVAEDAALTDRGVSRRKDTRRKV